MKKQLPSAPGLRVPPAEARHRGFLQGLFYGLLPHTFCILFIVFSVVGATAATTVLQRVLYVPYLFQIIVALSLVFATLSAAFYLKRNELLSREGALFKWKYLTVMYATTVGINLLFFLVVFPMVANLVLRPATAGAGLRVDNSAAAAVANQSEVAGAQATITLQVSIPCSGHAPLITGELKKLPGITALNYRFPDRFVVTYDTRQVTLEQILGLSVFQEFTARVL